VVVAGFLVRALPLPLPLAPPDVLGAVLVSFFFEASFLGASFFALAVVEVVVLPDEVLGVSFLVEVRCGAEVEGVAVVDDADDDDEVVVVVVEVPCVDVEVADLEVEADRRFWRAWARLSR